MKFRSIGNYAKLLGTDYKSASLLLASEMLVKEYLAIKTDDGTIIMNDDNIEYYTVLSKKGLSLLGGSAASVFFGPLGHTVARRVARKTTGYARLIDGKITIVLIKLKNKKRVLVQVEEGGMRLIRSNNKIRKDEANKKDASWALNIIDEIFNTEKPKKTKLTPTKFTPTKPTEDSGLDDDDYSDGL